MSRARDFADLAGSADAGGLTGRNLIINGAMQVAQRGTSAATKTNIAYHTVDRFKIGPTNMGTFTHTQESDGPAGFTKSVKLECTTADASPAAADSITMQNIIEAQNLQHLNKGSSDAKSVTLSFYVKSNKTGTYTAEIFDGDNNRHISKTFSVSSSATWEYKTITFEGDTSGSLNNDNGVGFYVIWHLGAGSDFTSGTLGTSWQANDTADRVSSSNVNLADTVGNYFQLTGVQLEVGEKATPFEHESFTSQWHKCQRYCTVYNIGGGNVHAENFILVHHAPPGKPGHVDVNNRGEWQLEWPVKRASPTLTFTDLTNMRWAVGNNGLENGTSAGAMSVGTSPEGGTVFQNVASGITQGASDVSGIIVSWIRQATGNNPKIVIDAEL